MRLSAHTSEIVGRMKLYHRVGGVQVATAFAVDRFKTSRVSSKERSKLANYVVVFVLVLIEETKLQCQCSWKEAPSIEARPPTADVTQMANLACDSKASQEDDESLNQAGTRSWLRRHVAPDPNRAVGLPLCRAPVSSIHP